MSRVFISYRRSDARWVAGRIYDRLAEALGRDNVFFDVSSMDPGDDFVERIEETVGRCNVLLSIIGPNWISTPDHSGRRRLDGANDLVRVEIRAALERKIRVIPILVDGAPMPQPDELPADLVPLARRNAHELSFARFQDDLESFVRVLERILAGPSPAPAPSPQSVPVAQPHRPDPSIARGFATDLPFTVALETAGGVATPVLPKGTALPAEASTLFSTAADNQTAVEIMLSAGERLVSKENARIGAFQLNGIRPAKQGVPQIEIKAQVDTSLILTVTAEDLATHRREVLDAVDLTRIEIPPGAMIHDSAPEPAAAPPVESAHASAAPVARPRSASQDAATEMPFTIALETVGGLAQPLIPKGAALPAEVTEVFSTATDNQSSIEVKLSAGERPLTSENARIGAFQLTGIPPAPKGMPQIEITAKVDSALVLTVTALDRATRRKEVLGAVDLTHLETPLPRTPDPSPSARRETPSGSLKNLFGSFFGNNSAEPAAPGSDLRYDLTLTFDESFSGTEANVTVNGRHFKVKIPPGVESGNRVRLKGDAEQGRPWGARDLYLFLTVQPHSQFERQGKDIYFKTSLRPWQADRGLTVEVPRLGTRAPLKVTVPPGLASGTRLRLAGQGFPDPAGISAAGDLYVVIDIEKEIQQTSSGAA